MTIAQCSISPLTGPAVSFRLIPAGRFRAADGRPLNLAGWHLDAGYASVLIAASKSRKGDFLIDYEHQSLNASKNGMPAPAAGWFRSLEWREGDGLYVTDARWTEAAKRMLSNREYRYISPVFRFDASGNVTELLSAAVTNTPAIDGLTDLAAASYSSATPNSPQLSAQDMELLRHCFGDKVAAASFAELATTKAALSRQCNAVSDYERAETNAKLRHIFGENAAQID